MPTGLSHPARATTVAQERTTQWYSASRPGKRHTSDAPREEPAQRQWWTPQGVPRSTEDTNEPGGPAGGTGTVGSLTTTVRRRWPPTGPSR